MLNRKIAISSMSILAALGMMSAATFAVFTSAASNNNNTFGSGSLTLTLNGASGISSTPVFGVTNAAPGQSFDQKITLANTGTVPAGSVKVSSINVDGLNTELASVLTIEFFNDADNDGVFDGGDTSLGSGLLNDPSWANYTLPGVTLAAGGSFNLGARLTFNSDADSTSQGKSLNFNLNFLASQ